MNNTSNNSKPSASHHKRGHEGLTWFILFLLVLIIPNLVLAVTEQLTAGGRVAGIVMPLAVYGLIMSLSRKTGRTMILMFPVLFLGAFQMVLTYLYGRGPIAVDMWLNLVTTNSGEVGELLSQLLPAIVWVVVIYVPTIALAATLWAKKRWANEAMVKALRLPALFATAGALLFTALLSGLTPYSPTNDMFPLNAVCNLGMAFGRQTASVEYKETSKDFRFYAKCSFEDKEPETLVLVIGETSRADNWQLYGYSRKTNPLLAQVKGLTVFTNYMSQSNTTHKSVPILLSLAEADNYDILYHTKGIMQAFREAGYHTVFLSNQQRNHSFIDFSYADRYPDFMRDFKNDQYDGAKREYRPQLINAYDNSICQTDLLLRRIIEELASQGGSAAMVYTSDHGEDIFDDARHLFLHASPFPSFWQLHVPLVVWTSPAYRERHADIASCLNANRRKQAESNSVFHTLLTMGGVTTSYRNDSLSLASPSFTPHRRLFIDDHNEPRPYGECMQKEDFEAMQRHGINMK